jgi:hypothetical protein
MYIIIVTLNSGVIRIRFCLENGLGPNMKGSSYSEISKFPQLSFHSAEIGNSMLIVVSIECGHFDYWCMFSDKRCEIKCVFPFVVGIRIISIHISCDMYLRLGLHVPIMLYYVLPYKAKIPCQHGIGFILDRCIVYLGQTMSNCKRNVC